MVNALDSALLDNADPELPVGICERTWFQDEDGSYGLLLSFQYNNGGSTDPDDPDDSVDWDQADQALQDAFSDLFDLSIYGGYNDYNDYNELRPVPEG